MQERSFSREAVQDRLKEIRENIAETCDKYRKSGDVPEIMAVTKTVPPEVVNWVFDMGLDLLGENRVQEFQSKKDIYLPEARVHFIGHLQTNKVKYIINDMDMIQSVDSLKLGQEIDRLAAANGKIMDILCEVNIGGEESKDGISPDKLEDMLGELSALGHINIRGLMTIPPPTDSDIFLGRMAELYESLKDKYSMDTLSMGMTHDYVQAVRHGSTLVRIGSGLFGARIYT